VSPQRVRVQGDLFHGRIPDGAVYVGRAAPGLPRSPYANPFAVGRPVPAEYGGYVVIDAVDAVALYRVWMRRHPELVDAARRELAGWDLACWCSLEDRRFTGPAPCHVDVLIDIANGEAP